MFLKLRVRRLVISLCTLFFLVGCGSPNNNLPEGLELRNGDVIFRRGGSVMSFCVRAVDHKGFYTHVGILVEINGEFRVLHSVPDQAHADDFDRVKIESLEDFFASTKALNGAIYRTVLPEEQLRNVTEQAMIFYRQKIPFDYDYDLEDSTKIYCTELLVRSFNKASYDITAGNFTELDIVMFKGKHILPSDIQLNNELVLVYSF